MFLALNVLIGGIVSTRVYLHGYHDPVLVSNFGPRLRLGGALLGLSRVTTEFLFHSRAFDFFSRFIFICVLPPVV